MTNDLVSIIMLSHNSARYVEESVRSVINQTYNNWELIFIDDSSKDDTINMIMKFKHDDAELLSNKQIHERIKVSQTVFERGDVVNSQSALKYASGRWIAFLNVSDVWAPDKLERQIAFMEENGYAFSYHQYRLMDSESKDRGFLISGKEHVKHKDMLRCNWPGYLTVMYDSKIVGKIDFQSVWTNYYALWLSVSSKHDCYLMPASLATFRTKWNRFGKILLTNNFKWRYDAYRVEMGFGRIKSLLYTIRNIWYGIMKWKNYANRN